MKKIVNRVIILMAIFTKRVIVVLDMPDDIDDFFTFANGIRNSMAASPYFAGLAAKLATLLTNIGDLKTANDGTKTVPPTVTTTARDIELNKVRGNLIGLHMDVQGLANDAPSTDVGEDIARSAGIKVKKQGSINKQDLEVKDGPVSGSVTLVAKGIEEQRSAHDWGYSKDSGAIWVHVDPSIQATTDITGLTPGDEIIVRHREVLPEGCGNYTISEPFIVR
jgi:hypothetical protein